MASARNLGSLTIDLIAKIGGWTAGLTKAERDLDRSTKRMNKMANDFGRSIGTSLRGAAAGFLAFAGVSVSIGAVANALKGAIDRADDLRDFSIQLGVSAESASKLSYAATQTGTSVESLSKSLVILSKNATLAMNPKSRQAGLFKALLGPDYEKDLGNLETLVPKVSDALNKLDESTAKTGLTTQLFGRSGAELKEFLSLGSQGFKEMGDRATELGIVLSKDTLDAADQFNDKLADLKAAGSGLATQVASELLPRLTTLVDWATDFVSDGDNARKVTEQITMAMDALAQAISAVAGAGELLGGLREQLAGVDRYMQGIQDRMGIMAAGDFVAKKFPWLDKPLFGTGPKRADFSNVQGTPTKLEGVTVTGNLDEFARAEAKRLKEQKALQDRINKYLGNPSGKTAASKTPKAGKSDEEKEAERLQKAYEQINANLTEQIALFGKTTEAAKVYYDVTQGELKDLTPVQKETLLNQAQELDLMNQRQDALEKEIELRERQKEAVADLLEDLKFESELLGKTKEDQEILNNLRYAGVDANSEYGKSIIEATKSLQEQSEAVRTQVAVQDSFRDGFEGLFTDLISGSKSAKEAFQDFAASLLNSLARIAAQKIVDNLFGQQGSTQSGSAGGFAQFLGSLMSSYGGGRASGGSVGAGQWYRVNENGPEMLSVSGKDYLMMGAQAGRVTPNNRLGSPGGNVQQNFYTLGLETRRTQERKAQLSGREAQRAMARNGR